MLMKRRFVCLFVFLAVVVVLTPLAFVQLSHLTVKKASAAGTGMPHVVGNRIVDGSGNTLMLRGADIEDLYNSANLAVVQYEAFSTTVQIMHNQWHMNVIRIQTCNWLWQRDPTNFMNRLKVSVSQATQAGLYVILDLYDHSICDPPYNPFATPYHMPRPAMVTYLQALATTFKSNPMVMFDLYNEPSIRNVWRDRYTDADWNLWLNGGTADGQQIVGQQTMLNTVRATGAKQIILVEGYSYGETFYNIGSHLVKDPLNNIVYEVHKYGMNQLSTQWDKDFGFMSAKFPVLVGEWALMAGGRKLNCYKTPQSDASQVVSRFLNYMSSHNMSWTAFAFNLDHLMLDVNNYTPSTFNVPADTWCTHNGLGNMGLDIKNYLANNPPS
jgi:hypothetical protein